MSPLSEVEEDLKVIRRWQPRARRGIRYNVFYLNGLGGKGAGEASAIATADVLNPVASLHHKYRFTDDFSRIPIISGSPGQHIHRGTGD